jgi:hypothetical protein
MSKMKEWKPENVRIIRLTGSLGVPDTSYSNDFMIVTFFRCQVLPGKKHYSLQYRNHLRYIFGSFLAYILNKPYTEVMSEDMFSACEVDIFDSGKIRIFSKTENKFITEIIRKEWGFCDAPLVGAGGDEYYLPDGTLLLSTTTWMC